MPTFDPKAMGLQPIYRAYDQSSYDPGSYPQDIQEGWQTDAPGGGKQTYSMTGEDLGIKKPESTWVSFRDGPLPIVLAAVTAGGDTFATSIGTQLGFEGSTATFVGNVVVDTAAQGGDIKKGLEAAGLGTVANMVTPEVASSIQDSLSSSVANGTISQASADAISKGLSKTVAGAIKGAGGAAIAGGDVGKGAASGALAGGVTSGIKSGLDVINPPDVAGEPGLSSSKSPNGEFGSINYSLSGGAPVSQEGLTAPEFKVPADATKGLDNIDYSLISQPQTGSGAKITSGTDAGQGLSATAPAATNKNGSANYSLSPSTPQSTTNSQLASILSQGLLSNVGGSSSPTVASPAAFGSGDVIQADTSLPGGVQDPSKAGKNKKYPWGSPEGTSSLKEGLGI